MRWMLAPALALQNPDTPLGAEKVTDGPFQAVVAAVPDLDAFDREWAVQTDGAQITSTTRLVRNKPTFVVVLFGGCQKNEAGNCRIEVRHELTTPRGKAYDGLDGTRAEPVADIPMTLTNAFFLAPQVLGVRIEPGEELGPYRLRVTVSDKVARRKVAADMTLIAVEPE
jgi:hypothetical protein